jgi:tetratricopeptide (TPR) repeat protein
MAEPTNHSPNQNTLFNDVKNAVPVYKMPMNEIKPGMITAENIFSHQSSNKTPIIDQGTLLTAEKIARLIDSGIVKIMIEAPPSVKHYFKKEWRRIHSESSNTRLKTTKKLPRKNFTSKPSAPLKAPQSVFQNYTTLLIVNMASMRQTLRDMLLQLKTKSVDVATDGHSATEKLSTRKYDMVVCDFNLGSDKKNAQHVFEEAKFHHHLGPSAIFVIITGENANDISKNFMNDLPDDIIEKPFTKEILKVRLQKIIQRKSCLIPVDQALKDNNSEKALDICDKLVQQHPRNAYEIIKAKTAIYMHNKDFENARKHFEKILTIRDDVLWAKFGLGRIHFQEKNYALTNDLFQDITQQDPNFLPGFDWLAKTLEKLGFSDKAQEIAEYVVKTAPNAMHRQKNLGDIAHKNEDYEMATKSYKNAVKIGKFSIFKDISTYSGLAKSLSKTDVPTAALSVARDIRKVFRNDTHANFESYTTESIVYSDAGHEADAIKSIGMATNELTLLGADISSREIFDLAEANFVAGNNEEGLRLVTENIANFCDDTEIIHTAESIFKQFDVEKEGAIIISDVKQEIADLNNQGTSFFNDGNIEKALDLFRSSVEKMPQNKTMNGNYAQSLILFMQKNGTTEKQLYECKQILIRLNKIDPYYKKYKSLLKLYQQLLTQPVSQ